MLPRSIDSLHLDTIDVENATRAPVLCLPGLFAGAWAFERLLPLIAARGHPVAALSYRGRPPNATGRRVGGISITDYANDACLAARALDRPIVIGHSMGGLISLMLAGRNLIRAAVLVSSAPPRGISVFSMALLARMTRYLPALLLNGAFVPGRRDLDAMVLNCVPEGERARIRARFTPDSGRAARQISLGVFKVPARAVRVPLLVVSGDRDRFVPLGVAAKLAKMYDAPLHVARGHGHFLLEEAGWEAEAGVILDWIAALPRVIRDAPLEQARAAAENSGAAGRVDGMTTNRK